MDVSLVSRALWQRRVLRGRERWTRQELVAGAGPEFNPGATEDRVRAALAGAGVSPPPVRVQAVNAIPAGASGKQPLVVSDAGISAVVAGGDRRDADRRDRGTAHRARPGRPVS